MYPRCGADSPHLLGVWSVDEPSDVLGQPFSGRVGQLNCNNDFMVLSFGAREQADATSCIKMSSR
jgi:hypothetical protein